MIICTLKGSITHETHTLFLILLHNEEGNMVLLLHYISMTTLVTSYFADEDS